MFDQNLLALYPQIEPYRCHTLPVSDLHTLYVEECGNPDGKPVVFLHGGPGAGCTPAMRRFFDPAVYRIVLFDQRGAGRSRPHAELRENTTWYLVDDIERIRQHLGIDRWQVFGGSWGSALALSYAQSHPDRVTQLILRGIFLLRKFELQWFYQYGASMIFADKFEPYLAPIADSERDDLINAYYRRLTGDDPDIRLEAARAWSMWEGATSHLQVNDAQIMGFSEDAFALSLARIECHYFVNKGFFDQDDQLLRNIDRIRDIPAVIVQGRYDVVCPVRTALDLHAVWPEADLQIIADAGHSAFEPGIIRALVAATDSFRG